MRKLILAATIILFSATVSGFSFGQNIGKAALIDLSGPISSSSGGAFSTSGITPSNVRELNDQAVNQGADAIIYEINSGGGAIVASKEVYRDIEDVDVPTVCRMRDVAASGGYMISLGCDKVVADSASLTGSIGVRSSYLEYSGLLDKLGVEYVNISQGSLKGIGSQYKNISDQEREILQSQVDRLHEDFVNQVENERNLTQNSTEQISTSQPFLGERAKELGLVDELGGRETAVSTAENLTGKDLTTFKVQTEPSFSLLSLFSADLNIGDLFRSSSPLKAEIG